MPYVDQFDGLVRAQDAGGRMRNVRTIVVFTDGIVICAVGVDGVWLVNRALLPGFGHLGPLLLAMIRPSQQVVRSRRQRAVRKHAMGWAQQAPQRHSRGPGPSPWGSCSRT
jgi:hypothetical protein